MMHVQTAALNEIVTQFAYELTKNISKIDNNYLLKEIKLGTKENIDLVAYK